MLFPYCPLMLAVPGSENIRRLDLGPNWGIYGPTEGGTFAVRKVLGGPAEQSIDLMKPSGERVGRWPFGSSSEVLGVAFGAVVTLPIRIATMYPPPGDFNLYPPSEPLKVQGKLQLFRDSQKETYVVVNGDHRYRIKRKRERGTAISLLENPPTLAIFDPVRKDSRDLWVRDLASGRSRTVRLDVAPASYVQFPEILVQNARTAYYYTREEPKSVVEGVPLLREREKLGNEEYYVRYLVRADLTSGHVRCLARVETADMDVRSYASLGWSAISGPDLVLMDGTLLVRANTALFFLDLD